MSAAYATDGLLRAEGIKALTMTQAQQLVEHNLNKIAHLFEQNKHLEVNRGADAPFSRDLR